MPSCPYCRLTFGEIPRGFDVDLLQSLRDEDIPEAAFWYCSEVLRPTWEIDGPPAKELAATLPGGLLAGYCLYLFGSEADNGGYRQWLTNSSGQLAEETLESARLIGSQPIIDLLVKVLRIKSDLEQEISAHLGFTVGVDTPHPPVSASQRREVKELCKPYWDALETLSSQNAAINWNWQPQLIEFSRLHPEMFVHDSSAPGLSERPT